MQRYSTEMMNVISAGLDKSATDAANAAQNRASTTMDVQSAADDTGLPMLVVRGPFNVVWQRLPAALEKVGMKVTDSTRSQGNMAVTYKPLSDSDWQELGASDPGPVSYTHLHQAVTKNLPQDIALADNAQQAKQKMT